MIKSVVYESGTELSSKLISLGLASFRVGDVMLLAETEIVKYINDKVQSGRTHELLEMLKGERAQGGLAFLKNFLRHQLHDSFIHHIQKNYIVSLTNSLQVNSTVAKAIGELVIPHIVDKMIDRCKLDELNEQELLRCINE